MPKNCNHIVSHACCPDRFVQLHFCPKDAGNVGDLHMVPLMEAVTFFWRCNIWLLQLQDGRHGKAYGVLTWQGRCLTQVSQFQVDL